MTKYVILIACIAVLVGVFVTRESKFAYTRPPDESPIIVKDKTSTILFVGDIMLGRNVENLIKQQGKSYPFVGVRELMTDNDGVIANLEGPIMEPHTQTPSNVLSFSFASTTPDLLAAYNIQVVSLANNHTADKGQAGYNQTRAFLDGAGIISVGHPFAFSDQYVSRYTMGGVTYLFVAFNLTNPNFDTKAALEYVRGLERAEGDYLVAMVHGGDEYKLSSNNRQKNFYRGLIDAKVDLVIAHHPHVVQEIEQYKNKLIFYSLGNFIFDQYFSKDVEEGLAVRMTLSNDDAQFELIPIKGNHSQPIPMNEAEKQVFLKTLSARSTPALKAAIESGKIIISR